MTRQLSVSKIKRKSKRSNSKNVPTKGTKLRELYDLLFENVANWITLEDKNLYNRRIHDLEVFYGLDIRYRRLKDGYGTGKFELMLAGELIDNIYVDYIVNPNLANKNN